MDAVHTIADLAAVETSARRAFGRRLSRVQRPCNEKRRRRNYRRRCAHSFFPQKRGKFRQRLSKNSFTPTHGRIWKMYLIGRHARIPAKCSCTCRLKSIAYTYLVCAVSGYDVGTDQLQNSIFICDTFYNNNDY